VVSLVVVVHAASTVFLAGVIWTIQVVHYPLFARFETAGFAAAMVDHGRRISGVVVVPWGLQGLTTAWLLARPPAGVPAVLVWSAAVLAALPVVVTLAASVPAHRALGRGFDASVHARLLATNWLRTVAWTAHAVVAVAILLREASL
jgi:heme exporter protein D